MHHRCGSSGTGEPMAPDMQHPSLCHPHTGEPLMALGARRDGRLIWPVIGAAEDDGDGAGEDQDGDGDQQDDSADGAEKLGDPGKAALDRMKQQRNAAKGESKAWKDLAAEFGAASVDDLRERLTGKPKPSTKDDDGGQDPEQIRRVARREAQQAADTRIIRAEVKAAAGGKLADPSDAVRLLDLSKFELDDNGDLDEDEVTDAITDLLRRKPYLAAAGRNDDDGTSRTRRAPRPDRSQGSRGIAVSDSKEQAREQLARRGIKTT